MRALPSHGYRTGWTGRRDRALLVLSQVAGLTFSSIAELIVDDISVADGVAVVRTPGGTTTLRSSDDVVLCGPCALARWIHALDLTVLFPTPQAAAIIARAAPLTARSPHLCEGRLDVAEATRRMPVLPRTDAWGLTTLPADPRTAGTQQTAAARAAAPRAAAPRAAAPAAAAPGTTAPTLRSQAAADSPAPRPALRLSRYPSDGAPAANCDPSQNLEARALRLLGQQLDRTQ